MSDNFWNDGDDSDEIETNPMRVLREKAEADSKVIREMADELKEYRRERELDKLAGVAKSKGLDPSVVALATKAGFDANEQGLDGFLKEFGGLITKPAGEPEAEGEQPPGEENSVPADEQAALDAMAAASQGSTPAKGLDAVSAQIGQADSPEAVMAALSALRKG